MLDFPEGLESLLRLHQKSNMTYVGDEISYLLLMGCPKEPKSSHRAPSPWLEVELLVEIGAASPKLSNTDAEDVDAAGDFT